MHTTVPTHPTSGSEADDEYVFLSICMYLFTSFINVIYHIRFFKHFNYTRNLNISIVFFSEHVNYKKDADLTVFYCTNTEVQRHCFKI